MQLMWLSGPTANVVSLSIGRRTILTAVLAAALGLLALGGLLQLLGIRIAVDADSSWARTLGGVTSAGEQDRIEQVYAQQIALLQDRVDGLTDKVDALHSAKQAIVELIPVAPVKRLGLGGQGGPLQRLIDLEWFAPRAVHGLGRLGDATQRLDQRLGTLKTAWDSEIDLLGTLPLRLPLAVEHHLSSDYGFRRDPIDGRMGRHAGIDFVAAYGAPILATAGGTVVHAGAMGAYGLAVDVEHGSGFSTRYAHLSQIAVAEGDAVLPGQPIGSLGNSGRSTGPHLHYEIRVQGRSIHPLTAIVLDQAKVTLRSQDLVGAKAQAKGD